MAMLAEKRSKEKWSDDPRNTTWSNDKGRYGYQMLEKMGWSHGKGLGRQQNGKTSHIRVKRRGQNLGLGARESYDKNWIAQQEDFNNLLSALQQHGGSPELKTKEQKKKAMLEVAKASRKRVFYKKFIRSKDTSQYSEKDIAGIFGKTSSQSAPATPQNQSDNEAGSEDSITSCPNISQAIKPDSGFVTFTSKHNIHEYFVRRMKELKEATGHKGNEGDDDGRRSDEKCEVTSSLRHKKPKKKRKKKYSEENVEKQNAEVEVAKKKRKRTKGGRHSHENGKSLSRNEATDDWSYANVNTKLDARSEIKKKPKQKTMKKCGKS